MSVHRQVRWAFEDPRAASVHRLVTMLPRVTHVARHRLLRLLGVGDAAEVDEVLTPEGERRALELLRADVAPRPQHQGRLGQEGEAIAMIEHVNVVRFHDAGVEQGRVWLLLELVDGPDLRRVGASIDRGRRSIARPNAKKWC